MQQISRRKFMGLLAGASTVIFAKLNIVDQSNNYQKYTKIYQQWINEKNIEPETYLNQLTLPTLIEPNLVEELIISDFRNNRVFIIDGLFLSEIEGALIAAVGSPV